VDIFNSNKLSASCAPAATNLMRLCYLRPDKEGNVLSYIATHDVKKLLYTDKNPFAVGTIKEDYTKRMKKLEGERVKLRAAISSGSDEEAEVMERIRKQESIAEQKLEEESIAKTKAKVFKL